MEGMFVGCAENWLWLLVCERRWIPACAGMTVVILMTPQPLPSSQRTLGSSVFSRDPEKNRAREYKKLPLYPPTSLASIVIAALSTLDTGQPAFAAFAAVSNAS